MKKNLALLAALVLAPFFASHASAAPSLCDSVAGNLVTNCGFENGDFSGWTLSGNLQGGVGGNYIYIDNSTPNTGNYDAAMGAQSQYGQTASGDKYGPVTTLSQNLAGLQKGFYYEVAFFLDNNGCSVSDPGCPGYYNHFDASLDGRLLYSVNNLPNSGGAYDEYVFVTDTPNDQPLSGLTFDFTNDNDVFYFDDVVVTSLGATPEPASFLLVTPALGGLLLFARRRRRASSK